MKEEGAVKEEGGDPQQSPSHLPPASNQLVNLPPLTMMPLSPYQAPPSTPPHHLLQVQENQGAQPQETVTHSPTQTQACTPWPGVLMV